MLKVNARIEQKLLGMAEAGMGYQIVEATFSNNAKTECLILNAVIAEPIKDGNIQETFKSVNFGEANRLYKYGAASNDIIDVSESHKYLFRTAFKFSESATHGADAGVLDGTVMGEKFLRFSAFDDDRRVDKIHKCLYPGTFATTFSDGMYCLKVGIDPRSRYALPSQMEIKYLFLIVTIPRTPVQRGTVQPANGWSGGGDEVIFPDGTTDNTVILPPHSI